MTKLSNMPENKLCLPEDIVIKMINDQRCITLRRVFDAIINSAKEDGGIVVELRGDTIAFLKPKQDGSCDFCLAPGGTQVHEICEKCRIILGD